MLVEDYLRPAAVKVGVLKEGEKVRFRYHTLRHSLASSLVRKGTDVKTVQRLLRHSDDSTTLAIYAHSMREDRLAAQGDMLKAMMKPPSDAGGLDRDVPCGLGRRHDPAEGLPSR